jgi:hypothetical protein
LEARYDGDAFKVPRVKNVSKNTPERDTMTRGNVRHEQDMMRMRLRSPALLLQSASENEGFRNRPAEGRYDAEAFKVPRAKNVLKNTSGMAT